MSADLKAMNTGSDYLMNFWKVIGNGKVPVIPSFIPTGRRDNRQMVPEAERTALVSIPTTITIGTTRHAI